MGFWDRVELGITRENTTYSYIAEKLGLWESRVSGWHRGEKKIIPQADYAVIIAKILKTTVEELVEGEAGKEYVGQLMANEGRLWEPPERIADIVASLKELTDRDLDIIRGTISGILGRTSEEGTNPPAAAGERKAV